MPLNADFQHDNSIKSNASSMRHRVTAEQAFLNSILQSIADQVVDITSFDVASNQHDYFERAQMYEVKIPEVFMDDSSLPQPTLQHSNLLPYSVDTPEIVLSGVGGVTHGNLLLIEEHTQRNDDCDLLVARDDQLVIEFTLQ